MNLSILAKDEKGQAGAVNTQIQLIVSLMVAVIVVYQLFVSGVGPTSDRLITADTIMLDQDFAFGPTYWDNASTGDNNTLNDGIWTGTDYAVWDNTGPQAPAGTRAATWTRWYQSLTLPAYEDGVTAASISVSFLLSDNTEIDADNCSLYVTLQRPGGDNVVILSIENNTSLMAADNTTFTTIDNDITSSITAAGTYILFLQDNIDRVAAADAGSDNYGGFVWTNASMSITADTSINPVYDAAALAAFQNVQLLAWAGIGLMAVVIIILAAAVLMQVIRGGFGGGKGL